MASDSALADRLRLRRATPDDTPHIAKLLAVELPDSPRVDERILRWQYWESPYGSADSWLWMNDDEPVGHWAALPLPLCRGDEVADGGLAVDVMTLPAFRTARLYKRVVDQRIIAIARDYGRPFFAVTSERATYPPGGLDPLRAYVLPLDPGWLSERTRVPSFVASAILASAFRRPAADSAREVHDLPDDLEALWRRCRNYEAWGILKDDRWWRWRYESHPLKVYRYFAQHGRDGLRAFAVTAPGREHVVHLVELLATDAASARAVVGAVAEASPGAGAILARTTADASFVHWAPAARFRGASKRFESSHGFLWWYPKPDDPETRVSWALMSGDTDAV